MASTSQRKRKPPEGLVVVTQRFYKDDIETLKRMGEAARMPWGEVLRRLVHEALPHVHATVAGVTINISGRFK